MFVGSAIAIGASKIVPTRYFNFDGNNDKMDFSSAISLTSNFAICFWGKISAEGSWSICGDQTNFAAGRLAFNTNTSAIRYDCSGPQTGTFATDESSADGRWHYFILERNSTGTAPGLTLYRDLVEIGNVAAASFSGTVNVNRIGYRPDDSGFPSWSGGMREFRIYTRATTSAEKQNLYDGKSISSTGLAAYWKMNETSGSSALDYSGNNRTLTIANHTESTFFAKEIIPNLFNNRIGNGGFDILSGDDPGSPWSITGPTYISVTDGVVTFNTDGTNTRLTQNNVVNAFDSLLATIDIVSVTTGSVSIGSDTNNNAPFLFACTTPGTIVFPYITDRPNFVVRRTGTAACLSSFDNVTLTRVRNYIINGDFRKVLTDGSLDPRNWSVTNGAGYTVSATGGVCTLATTVASNAEIYQTVLTSGQSYRLYFYISAISGTLRLYCGSTIATWTTTGWKSVDFVAGSSTIYLTTYVNSSSIDLSAIIIKRL